MAKYEVAFESIIQTRLDEHLEMAVKLSSLNGELAAAARVVAASLAAGGKLLLFGNGGSAADCQHLAAELVNRFVLERRAYAALALTTDSSNLTSIANDYAYEQIFARQIESLGRAGDVALGISTSGSSKNVLAGLARAREMDLRTIAFTGDGGGKLAGMAEHLLTVPARDTARIQEGHIFLGHLLCELVERTLAGDLEEPAEAASGGANQEGGRNIAAPSAAVPVHPAPGPRYFVHPSSYVDEGATIGDGTKIWFFNHVQSGSRLGRDCIIGQNVNIDRDAQVGDRVKIQNNVSVYKGVIVEDDVFLGPSMVFTNVINPRSHVNRKNEFLETRVGRGASIGANATIVCGHSVGPFAFIGAGAVVTKDVPAYALVTGNPARVRGWICQCGVKLHFHDADQATTDARCQSCGKHYQKTGHQVSLIETIR